MQRLLLWSSILAVVASAAISSPVMAQSGTGTLTINIESKFADGRTYLGDYAPFWLYVTDRAKCCVTDTHWQLVASRGNSDSDPNRLQPISVRLPQGRYAVELITGGGPRQAPLGGSVCTSSVTVPASGRAEFQLPADCGRPFVYHNMEQPRNHVFAMSKAYWDEVHERAEYFTTACRRATEPLFAALERVIRTTPTRPVVFLDYGSLRGLNRSGSIGGREFDARQVRLLVDSYKQRCWEWLANVGDPPQTRPEDWPAQLWQAPTPSQVKLIQSLTRQAVAEIRRLDRLNEIADILEGVERARR